MNTLPADLRQQLPDLTEFDFNDPEFAKTSQQLWKHLDYLAEKDPIAYRNVIQKAAQEVSKPPSKKPHVTPLYCIKTKGTRQNGSSTHYINLCTSPRAQQPLDEDDKTVPIVMSEQRVGVDEESKRKYNVYDAVVHPSVAEKAKNDNWYKSELIKLVFGGMEETFNIVLQQNQNQYELLQGVYKGPDGWDDDGQPVKGFVAPTPSSSSDEALDTPTTEALLSKIARSDAASVDDGELSGCELKELKLRRDISESTNKKRVLIQDLSPSVEQCEPAQMSQVSQVSTQASETSEVQDVTKEPTTLPTEEEEDRSIFEPYYTTQSTDSSWSVHIQLPEVTSINDLTLSIASGKIHLQGKKYKLLLQVSAKDVVLDDGHAKFVKSKKVLVVKFPKRSK